MLPGRSKMCDAATRILDYVEEVKDQINCPGALCSRQVRGWDISDRTMSTGASAKHKIHGGTSTIFYLSYWRCIYPSVPILPGQTRTFQHPQTQAA
jgi:hypothetical protein